ncbi:RecQ family ATP-dependent DNA helicase [Marinomonas sp. MED121]|uniref:RecQ family ATP-dependent DNA helicase n=1 Tax=Marinomonas sp. MED121 TaxID=314277 RepID=UPI00103AE47D|nr:RecQ family ATP-dependent DNA helicase [Marinomonas sp. MED121]
MLDNPLSMERIKELLSQFGHQDFLPLQQEAIETLVNGQDLLLISPTGGGKSLVYQLSALRLEGVAVIVCPLLALMSQQVEKLKSMGVRAEFLNSTLNPGEQDDLAMGLRRKSIDLLFLSPEKLLQPSVMGILQHSAVAFVAIDEAHCIAQWGEGFRPEYGSLGKIREEFGAVPIVAMSGSADAKTQKQIINSLSLHEPKVLQHSFNRENIEINISQKKLAKKQLLNFILSQCYGESGIVYCRSRKKVETLSAWLNSQGIKSLFFHANISEQDKAANMKVFTEQSGVVMVATSAFGMGLDFNAVRYVVHMDLPNSLESYYQEIGRAGRDGLKAKALLLYGLQDVLTLLQFEMEVNLASVDDQARTYDFIRILEGRGCRRRLMLNYFGEKIEDCGNCDRCLAKKKEHNLTIAAQKFLSLLHKTKGTLTISVMIQILLGKTTKAVKEVRGQEMKLFAKGQEINEVMWKSLVRYLISHQYIAIYQFMPFQLLMLEKAKALLTSKTQVILQEDTYVPNHDVAPFEDYKKQLFSWHLECEGISFSSKQLDLIVRHQPKSFAAMSRLTGIAIHLIKKFEPPVYVASLD